MKPIFRATAILGSSSLINIAIGLVAAKAWAVLLGPSGLGFIGLLQSLVGLATMIMAMSIGTAMVRLTASALAEEDAARVAALRRAAWLIFGVSGAIGSLLLFFFRERIGGWVLDDGGRGFDVALMVPAILFNFASSIQGSQLNAHHRIGALAKMAISVNLIGTGVSLLLVWHWRDAGIAPAVIASGAVSWAVSRYFLVRQVGPSPARPDRGQVVEAGRALLRFGAPLTASMLVGTGVQYVTPILVLHSIGQENLGFVRAAGLIAVSYLGFLYTAMAQDYYPRISAVHQQPEKMIDLANQQLRLIMTLGVPMVLGVLAITPYLVPFVYSGEFRPAVGVLEWFLIGDIVRFPGWVMGFILLARGQSSRVFLTELAAGLTTLGAYWPAMHWFGLAGPGIAFVLTYLVHNLVTWSIVRRDIGFTWTRQNKITMGVGLLAALTIRGLSLAGLDDARIVVALLLALAIGLFSLRTLWTELEVGNLPMLQRFSRSG